MGFSKKEPVELFIWGRRINSLEVRFHHNPESYMVL